MPIARAVMYLATIGGVAWAVKALLFGPPPLWLALIALIGYVGLITAGVIFARFSMFADVLSRGPTGARGVALTFDDGPDPQSTPQILDLLDEARAEAAFFVIGRKAERYPELVREIVARGHVVGVHGYSHDRLMALRWPWTARAELERAVAALEKITGERPTMFRAPVGHISPGMARAADDLDLITIGWTIKSLDGWSGARPLGVIARVLPHLRDGSIVLLHDASERGGFVPASVEALPELLEVAARRQLDLVRVDRWLDSASANSGAIGGSAAPTSE